MAKKLKYTADQINSRLYTAGVDVYVELETIQDVPLNTPVSPTTAQLTGFLQSDWDYVDGSLVYTGNEPHKAIIIDQTSLEIPGFSNQIRVTNGKDGAPCEIGWMPSTTLLGNPVAIPGLCVFDIVNGTSVDFFFERLTGGATADVEILKGRYTILKIG